MAVTRRFRCRGRARYAPGISVLAIKLKQMSWAEKLRTMEGDGQAPSMMICRLIGHCRPLPLASREQKSE